MTARFCACNACRYFFLSYEFIEFIKLLRVVNLPSEGRLWQATHRWELMWHETNKKSPRWGGEGWRPIVCVKPKSNGKQASPLSFAVTPTVTRDARHSPPSPLRKKSRFAEKKSASPKKNCACRKKWRIVCIKGGMSLPVVACHNRPSEAQCSGCCFLQAALGFASLACPQYAISDGRFAPRSPNKSRLRRKTTAPIACRTGLCS